MVQGKRANLMGQLSICGERHPATKNTRLTARITSREYRRYQNGQKKKTMAEGELLAGLDDVPWGMLAHAYGTADDVPKVLRAIASGDADTAAEAVDELFCNIWHQGTVYEATPYAVPFLARMAVAGLATADLVQLLGLIAEKTSNADDDPTGARTAVAAQAGLICSLLDSPEDDVRAALVWTVTQSGPAEVVATLLRARWDIEQVSFIRAGLLRGLFLLDSGQGITLAGDTITTGTAEECLVAAWVHASSGLPWSSRLSDAATAWFRMGVDLDNMLGHGSDNTEPWTELLLALCQRGVVALATKLAVSCLGGQEPVSGDRERALSAVDELAQHYRIPVAELGVALMPMVTDEALRGTVLGLLCTLNISMCG